MAIEIIRVAPGSKFKLDGVEGVEFELVKTLDGGFNWMGADSHYCLTQGFYFSENPTPNQVEYMKKHLTLAPERICELQKLASNSEESTPVMA